LEVLVLIVVFRFLALWLDPNISKKLDLNLQPLQSNWFIFQKEILKHLKFFFIFKTSIINN
jgi:hypothetical protein